MDCNRDSITSEDYVDFIVEYNGNREYLTEFYRGDCINFVDDRYAVVYRPKPDDYMEMFARTEYAVFPKVFGLMDTSSMEAVGAVNVQQENILGLDGAGILVAVIDTGIDIFHEVFRDYAGNTRIVEAWDQTAAPVDSEADEAFGFGRIYDSREINRAIKDENRILSDETGHGTFITGIAAGSNTGEFTGAAPKAGIVVVKLKQAKRSLRELYGIPDAPPAYAENDIMLGIKYVTDVARKMSLPVSILIGLGTNSGNHAGQGALASYMNSLGIIRGMSLAVAGGNEGTAGHHFMDIINEEEYSVIEFNVSERDSLTLEIWGKSPGTYAIAMEIPGGEFIERIAPRFDKSEKIMPLFGGGIIYVDYFLVEEQSGDELIMIRLINPANGLWRIRVYGTGDTEKRFDAWLPITGFISDETVFVRPNPFETVTNPGNAGYISTVGAYNHRDDSLYINSGRGYTADGRVKPDYCAPGVMVMGPGRANNYIYMSGTSVAAAHVAGCAALMLQWGMRVTPFGTFNGNQIRQYFIRGAIRQSIRKYPNREWGYGIVNMYNTFLSLT